MILGVGYNGFPRGCGDDVLPWAKKSASDDPLETKYAYVCHAEMNAIMNKNSADVKNGTMYVTMYPCNECAKLMIQAGIREVVYCEGKLKNDDAKNEQEKNLLAARNSSSPTTSSSLETTPIKTVAILEEKKVDPSYHASERLLALAGIKVRKYEPKVKVDLTYVC
jgi:tRNA(Arg) A34 adenosine deaminase TadA